MCCVHLKIKWMEILQNAEKMGVALRSISLRIRGFSETSEDGFEEVDEELKNITGDLIDLTKTAAHPLGVSIFKEGSTTEFKSLVDYLGEISAIWNEMSDVQQNAFLNKAFAKTQAQAGAAIIRNFDQVRNALTAMDQSFGSSEREMSIIEDSITFKVNRLQQTFVGFAQDLIDRGLLGDLVDMLYQVSTALTSVVTSADGLPGVAAILSSVYTLTSGKGGLEKLSLNIKAPLVVSALPGYGILLTTVRRHTECKSDNFWGNKCVE